MKLKNKNIMAKRLIKMVEWFERPGKGRKTDRPNTI